MVGRLSAGRLSACPTGSSSSIWVNSEYGNAVAGWAPALTANAGAGRILRLSSKLGDGFGRRHVRRRQQQLALAAFQLDQLIERLAAEYLVDALAQSRDRRDVQKLAASGYQLKSLAGMRQAVMRG